MTEIRGQWWDTLLEKTVFFSFTNLGYWLRRPLWKTRLRDYSLRGRVALVTGANSGVGRGAAEGLAKLGARVYLLVRNRQKGEAAQAEIIRQTGHPDIHTVVCDLSRPGEVRAFGAEFRQQESRLDVLVNNAGILVHERQETPEGLELTFATNVLGGFVLTAELQPLLRAAGGARVIAVSSGGMYTAKVEIDDLQAATGPFDGVTAYASSKRAQVILTELWAEKTVSSGVAYQAMHPGWVYTPGVKRSLPGFTRIMRPFLRNIRQGADTIVWLSVAEAAGRESGAFWFDRRRRATHRLENTRNTPTEYETLWRCCQELGGVEVR
ncbi:MAG: SDR family NAD(P)-dependent oxidoreductase [Acidobacteria bacterium]|nr:SDR family NAD(P)-dependent oxidoreductase [Acidobacteriota bacterium]